MKLSYKLSDGSHAKIIEYDLLSVDAKDTPYFKDRKISVTVTNGKNWHNVITMLRKDVKTNRCYFTVRGEKIYVADYEYLEIEELAKLLGEGTLVPVDIFVPSLIKNADKVAFIEQRWVPDMIYPVLGVRSYSGEYKFKHIVCVPIEVNYDRLHWSYKIETIPVDEVEKMIYGKENHYISDFYGAICTGYVTVIPRSDIDKYDYSEEQPFTRARKK